jgi:hypothetical protein
MKDTPWSDPTDKLARTPSTNFSHFDIETGPLPLEQLVSMMPTEWPLGNVKDPAKVAAAVKEKEQKWLEDAALSPVTGQVLAIGIKDEAGFKVIEGSEHDMLTEFWKMWNEHNRVWIGFNNHGFDFPFLLRRSWKWNVDPGFRPPNKVWELRNSIDLMDRWSLGDKQDRISLKNLARFLDLPPKLGDGADFATLLQTDYEAAVEYLKRDVELVELIAQRMRV